MHHDEWATETISNYTLTCKLVCRLPSSLYEFASGVSTRGDKVDVTALIGSQIKKIKKTLPRIKLWFSLGFEHCWKLFGRMSVHNSTKYIKKVQLFSDNLTKNILHTVKRQTISCQCYIMVFVTTTFIFDSFFNRFQVVRFNDLVLRSWCWHKSCFGLFTDKTRQFWVQCFLTFYRLNNSVVKRG